MRVVIGEDEALLRQGLTHVLEHAGYDVVGTAANATELLRQTDEREPDLVITDIRMPPTTPTKGWLCGFEHSPEPSRHGDRRAVAARTAPVRDRADQRPGDRDRLPAQTAHR